MLLRLCSTGLPAGQQAVNGIPFQSFGLSNLWNVSPYCNGQHKKLIKFFFVYPFLYDILHKRYFSLSFNSFYNFKSSSKTSEATSCFYSCTTVYDQCLSVLFIFDNTLFIWNSIPHCILSLTKAESFRKALRNVTRFKKISPNVTLKYTELHNLLWHK